jgi:glycosyltransferase involved in cell wall biosynthesis
MKHDHTMLEVCNYHGPYPGTFIPTLIAVGQACEERLGLRYHCVFPASMSERPWVGQLGDAAIEYSFLGDQLSASAKTRSLVGTARDVRARIVRSHFSRWDLQASIAARFSGAATVWHMHSGRGSDPPAVASWAKDLVKARTLGRVLCDEVFAVSDEIKRLAEQRGMPAARVHVVLNGIDVARFADLPSRALARAELGLDGETPVVLGFAWSPLTKGADILVEAARPLAEAGRLAVVVVGDAKTLAAAGVSAPWLRIVDPVEDVRGLFAAADVFVSASRDEGFPYAIGEAMAAGLPVISSDIPGPSVYFASDGVTTFTSGDARALRAELQALLDDPSRRRPCDINREFVERHLGLGAHVASVVDRFERLLSMHR